MIVVVRHGETEGNRQRFLQPADTPLNARGVQQATRLAQRLFGQPWALVLCSDLPRARMTVEPLLELSGAEVEYSPLLQERNFGDLRGTLYTDLGFDPFAEGYHPPRGESWEAFHQRAADAFALIVRRRRERQGNLLVVTHGMMCRALVLRHTQVERLEAVPVHFGNTSVTVLRAEPPHAVDLLNCCAHLEGSLVAPSPHPSPGDEPGAV